MTRSEVSQLVADAVCKLKPKHSYGRGRITEFNSILQKDLPAIWFETVEDEGFVNPELAPTSMLPIDSWPIRLHITKKNENDADQAQYEDIIDQCDLIAQALQFIFNKVVSESRLLTILDISRSPFIKRHSDNLSGVLFSFTLRIPDQTDLSEYCE